MSLNQQVWASGKNDPGSNYAIHSTFATNLSSNFIIEVINSTYQEHPPPIRDAYSFQFGGQRLSVTIHLIG